MNLAAIEAVLGVATSPSSEVAMAWMPYRTSIVCARLSALFIALAIFGCVVEWFRDGAIGVVSIVVLGLGGFVLAAAAHRFSKRSV